MATASGEARGARRLVMPFVAYAIVLASLAAAAVAFWMRQGDSVSDRARRAPAPPVVAVAAEAPVDPPRTAAGLKLPPRPEVPAPKAPVPQPPTTTSVPAPVPIPSAPAPSALPSTALSGAENPTDPAAAADNPAPAKSRCTVAGPWPTERTEQGKAIQGMLRDLGLYDGTVYGTVGPTTRAAIRKFQASAGQPETGDPDQSLFDQLRKTCGAP